MPEQSAPLPPQADHGSLLRILGPGFGLSVALGSVVGQGILRTPGIVAGSLGDTRLIIAVWLGADILTLIDALSISEL